MARRSSTSDVVSTVVSAGALLLVLYLLYKWLQAGGLKSTLPGGVYANSGTAGAQQSTNIFSSLLQKIGLGGSSRAKPGATAAGVPANPSNYGPTNPLSLAVSTIGNFSKIANTAPNFADLGGGSLSDYVPDEAAASGLSDYSLSVPNAAPVLFDVSQNAMPVGG